MKINQTLLGEYELILQEETELKERKAKLQEKLLKEFNKKDIDSVQIEGVGTWYRRRSVTYTYPEAIGKLELKIKGLKKEAQEDGRAEVKTESESIALRRAKV